MPCSNSWNFTGWNGKLSLFRCIILLDQSFRDAVRMEIRTSNGGSTNGENWPYVYQYLVFCNWYAVGKDAMLEESTLGNPPFFILSGIGCVSSASCWICIYGWQAIDGIYRCLVLIIHSGAGLPFVSCTSGIQLSFVCMPYAVSIYMDRMYTQSVCRRMDTLLVCYLWMRSGNRNPGNEKRRMEKKPGICKITFHKRAYLEEGDAFTVSLFFADPFFPYSV